MRMARGATLAAAAALWGGCAWLLLRTSVPTLHLSGLDSHRFFAARELSRARSYSRGEDVLWLLEVAARLVALVVVGRRLPRSVRGIGLGRIGSAIVVGMVLLATFWFVALSLT